MEKPGSIPSPAGLWPAGQGQGYSSCSGFLRARRMKLLRPAFLTLACLFAQPSLSNELPSLGDASSGIVSPNRNTCSDAPGSACCVARSSSFRPQLTGLRKAACTAWLKPVNCRIGASNSSCSIASAQRLCGTGRHYRRQRRAVYPCTNRSRVCVGDGARTGCFTAAFRSRHGSPAHAAADDGRHARWRGGCSRCRRCGHCRDRLHPCRGHPCTQRRFSRQNEQEADRIGIVNLERAGYYDPRAMPSMFGRLMRQHRYDQKPPEFLLTHPVSESRIADTTNRAEQYAQGGTGTACATS